MMDIHVWESQSWRSVKAKAWPQQVRGRPGATKIPGQMGTVKVTGPWEHFNYASSNCCLFISASDSKILITTNHWNIINKPENQPIDALGEGLRWCAGDLGDLADLEDLADLADLGDLEDLNLGNVEDLGDQGDLGDPRDLGDLGDLGDWGDLGEWGDQGDIWDLVDLVDQYSYPFKGPLQLPI